MILTVPVPILQNDTTFVPSLPESYQRAMDDLHMLAGLKIVLQFETQFYEDAFTIEDYDIDIGSGRFFYNPYHGQESCGNHIMIIEILGQFAEQFIDLNDQQIVDIMLEDLDRVFGSNLASNNLMDSYVQNWSAEPYTRGAFSFSNERSIQVLREPLASGKIIFAGEAIPYDGDTMDWGYVHGAAFSGRAAAGMITSTASPTTSAAPTVSPTIYMDTIDNTTDGGHNLTMNLTMNMTTDMTNAEPSAVTSIRENIAVVSRSTRADLIEPEGMDTSGAAGQARSYCLAWVGFIVAFDATMIL